MLYSLRFTAILFVLITQTTAQTPAGAAEPPPAECALKDIRLPADYALFAAGGYRGRPLDFVIDKDSGQLAGQVDITVNYPDKPVALMFSNYEPTLWNVSWTKGTKIVAIYTSGYYRQAVAGIDDDVPTGTMTYKSEIDQGGADSPCFLMTLETERGSEIGKRDAVAYAVFKRKPDKTYRIFERWGMPRELQVDKGTGHYEPTALPAGGDATKITIGAPVAPGTEIFTSAKTAPETFHDKSAPPVGQDGFSAAVESGILRKATMDDVDEFIKAYVASLPKPNTDVPPVEGGNPDAAAQFPRIHNITNSFVALKAFEVPLAVNPENEPNIFVAKGAPVPTGNPRGASVYDINTGKCIPVVNCPDQMSALTPHAPSERDFTHMAAGCYSELGNLPADFDVIATASYKGRPLDFAIDKSGILAGQIDVKVNHPEKPVALLLGDYEPTIWNISWTKGTNIIAVLVGGYHAQVIAGLDEKTPRLIRTYDSLEAGKNGSCDYISLFGVGDEGAGKVNPFSRAAFGRGVTKFISPFNGVLNVGARALGSSWIRSPGTSPESFHDKNAALTGELGIKVALDKGLIRHATPDDYHAWTTAWIAKNPDGAGKEDVPPTFNLRRKGAEIPVSPLFFTSGYVVLKPFTIPEGAGGEYMVAKGVPMPQPNSENRNIIYSMDDATCTPKLICLMPLADQ